ncbi:MAG: sigma-70 family RNA polymerase sigma factor [Elusimicrobia bacterium]|nr:sigma-70 family RNA polymerase sigma factor [Elusimicrobiota bacterium]
MDAETFAGLIAQAGDKAYNFAYRLSGNEQDARDLVQESFARAFEHAGAYDASRPFDSWLLRILHNVFLDGMRRHWHSRTVSLDAPSPVEDTGWADLLPEDETPAHDELARRESLDLLQKALDRVPLLFKAAVVLCDIEGLSYEEIAQVADVPVGTVRSRIHQGRLLLRREYEALERRGGVAS